MSPAPPGESPAPPIVADTKGRISSLLGLLPRFGSGVVVQALLSVGNLLVGLILVRRASNAQYGSYVLVLNALMLATGAQYAYLGPPIVSRLTRFDAEGRAMLVGGLIREQRRLLLVIGATVFVIVLGLRWAGRIDNERTLLMCAGAVAVTSALSREFFRLVLLAYRLPRVVLQADVIYVTVLVTGSWLATRTPWPAVIAVCGLVAAGAGSAGLLTAGLRRHHPWSVPPSSNILLEIAPEGTWTSLGSAIHWSFSQGYNYLIAGTTDVASVAATAATRLLMMPVNTLSTGIGQLMFPVVANWLRHHRAEKVFKRLVGAASLVSAAGVVYFIAVWLLRNAIFDRVFHKSFAERDVLLRLWMAVFLLMTFRDQLLFLPLARERYRTLTYLALGCAIISLSSGYLAIGRMGAAGGVLGLLIGEALNVTGLLVLSRIEIRRPA